MDFHIDPVSKKGTIWFRRGGIPNRSASVNGQIQNFDIDGQLISVEIPNVFATINLANIPCTTDEHDHIRDHLIRHTGLKSGG